MSVSLTESQLIGHIFMNIFISYCIPNGSPCLVYPCYCSQHFCCPLQRQHLKQSLKSGWTCYHYEIFLFTTLSMVQSIWAECMHLPQPNRLTGAAYILSIDIWCAKSPETCTNTTGFWISSKKTFDLQRPFQQRVRTLHLQRIQHLGQYQEILIGVFWKPAT